MMTSLQEQQLGKKDDARSLCKTHQRNTCKCRAVRRHVHGTKVHKMSRVNSVNNTDDLNHSWFPSTRPDGL